MTSLTSPVLCASDDLSFYRLVFLIYLMSLDESDSLNDESEKLGLTLYPLVHTIFVLFLCVLMSPLLVLVFWGMTFLHQQESSPKVVDFLHYFGAQIPNFPSNIKISFIVIV